MFLAGSKYNLKRSCSRTVIFLTLATMLIWGARAFAFNVQYGLTHTVESTSNVLLAPDISPLSGIKDTINTSLFYLNGIENQSSVDVTVDLQLNYLNFGRDDVSRDISRNTLDSELLWTITPRFYSWFLEDNYTQTRINPSLIFNQENTQDVNEFGTGPRFQWYINDTVLNLDTSVYYYDYNETDNDTTNSITRLRWGKKMPSGMSLSLVYSTTFVTYQGASVLNDYNKSALNMNFQYRRNTNDLELAVGKTLLDSEDISQREFSNVEISYTRQLSRYSNVNLSYTSGLADQNDAIDTGGTSLSNVYENQSSLVSYHKNSSTLGLELEFSEIIRTNNESGYEDYLSIAEITLSRVLAPRSQLLLTYSDSENSVKNIADYTDNIITQRLEYLKRFNNRFSFRVFVSEVSVTSTTDLREYSDKRIGMGLTITR